MSDDPLSRAHQEIARLTAERDEARRELAEVKDRNVKLLSKIQEYEAREY
jgi:chromosome segregation ATPase